MVFGHDMIRRTHRVIIFLGFLYQFEQLVLRLAEMSGRVFTDIIMATGIIMLEIIIYIEENWSFQ